LTTVLLLLLVWPELPVARVVVVRVLLLVVLLVLVLPVFVVPVRPPVVFLFPVLVLVLVPDWTTPTTPDISELLAPTKEPAVELSRPRSSTLVPAELRSDSEALLLLAVEVLVPPVVRDVLVVPVVRDVLVVLVVRVVPVLAAAQASAGRATSPRATTSTAGR
jgi:hypothetical protein